MDLLEIRGRLDQIDTQIEKLFAHDLDLLRHASSRIGIMYRGKLLEQGETEAVLNAPTHPYTRELIENFSYMRD